MQLGFGIAFPDLYEREGLIRLDRAFIAFLSDADRALADRLVSSRANLPMAAAESELLIALAPHVEDFIAKLFRIESEAQALAEKHNELAPLYSVKRQFVQRRALHKVKPADVQGVDAAALARQLFGGDFTELDFARKVSAWLQNESAHAAELELAARYAAWATTTPAGKAKHGAGVLFKTPQKLDFMKLVPVHTETARGFAEHHLDHLRHREGFALTDPGTNLTGALDEANYCIWCHEQGKDSCSKGLKEKAPAEGFRKTVFGVPLAGCPLEEKISEFHLVKARGQPLAALGIIAVDNPMLAATGHRICNDCMKSCIYQKQEPVNIPQIETGVLTDVLGYLKFRPTHVHTMEGGTTKAFASPRSWEKVARGKICDAPPDIRRRLIAANVGPGVAGEFEHYLKLLNLPSIEDIIRDPKGCHIPDAPSSKYALSAMISRNLNRDNFLQVGKYLQRTGFGREFEICCVLDASTRDQSLCEHKAYTQFIDRNGDLQL